MTLGEGALGEFALGEIPVNQGSSAIEACAYVQIVPPYTVDVQIIESCVTVEVQNECSC